MGAAGYVTVYDEAVVRATYGQMYPDNDIDQDWWYLETITAELDGKKWIFDYGDDQGYHRGSDEDFWFGYYDNKTNKEIVSPEEGQRRVLSVLRLVRPVTSTEVWT